MSNNTAQVIQRRPAVEARTGLARSTIYAKMETGDFPKPIKLGARSVGWLAKEIDDWIEGQVSSSRPSQTSGAK